MSFLSNRSKLPRASPPEMRRDLFDHKHQDPFPAVNQGGDMDFFSTGANLPSSSSAVPFLQPSPPLVPAAANDPLAGAIIPVSQLLTKFVISHPCTVIRRQCQVHQNARSLHITPFTLTPVVFNMIGQHGISTFWRGSMGAGVLWGLSLGTEIIIGDLFGLPRTVIDSGNSSKYWRHILLKGATYFLMTPFYISSFIETIRSGKGLTTGEDTRLMEVVLKGFDRMKYLVWGPRDHSRKFSLLHLAVPTVALNTTHYMIEAALYARLHSMAAKYVSRKPVNERTKLHEFIPQIFATMTSSVLTDLLLFPFETVLHRLYVQGTRTLIDDMDTGIIAISMKVKYDGFFHCFKTIVSKEGVWALYAGVGAVFLEYGLQMVLHKLVGACFDRTSEALRRANTRGSATPPIPSSFPQQHNQAMSPVVSPRRNANQISSPPRNPVEYPAFGELSANDPLAQFAAQTGKPLQPLFLRTDDPFGNHFGQ